MLSVSLDDIDRVNAFLKLLSLIIALLAISKTISFSPTMSTIVVCQQPRD